MAKNIEKIRALLWHLNGLRTAKRQRKFIELVKLGYDYMTASEYIYFLEEINQL